jgi:hypothetical protein
MDNNQEFCPLCGADLQGKPIPEASRQHYGGATHFSRKIGIYSRLLDMTVAWSCPDCGRTWDRSTGKEVFSVPE